MLLHPKKTKFKSAFGRKRMKCITNPILRSSLKCFGIISYETGKISNKQIEALRKIMKRSLKSYGKFWLNIFPNISVTKKSEGIRMGKGKGNVKFWFNGVSKGTVIAEMNGCSWGQAKKVTRFVKDKLSVKVFLFLKKS